MGRLSPLDFAVMAPSLDRDGALLVLDRFQNHLHAIRAEGGISVRAGIATIEPVEGANADQLLQRAATAVDWAATERPLAVNE
jgi:GGDEF domain-containing protein